MIFIVYTPTDKRQKDKDRLLWRNPIFDHFPSKCTDGDSSIASIRFGCRLKILVIFQATTSPPYLVLDFSLVKLVCLKLCWSSGATYIEKNISRSVLICEKHNFRESAFICHKLAEFEAVYTKGTYVHNLLGSKWNEFFCMMWSFPLLYFVEFPHTNKQ